LAFRNSIERGVRVVEGVRLESVYTPQAYRGFESLPLCFFSKKVLLNIKLSTNKLKD
jgi:hypothetical protein